MVTNVTTTQSMTQKPILGLTDMHRQHSEKNS